MNPCSIVVLRIQQIRSVQNGRGGRCARDAADGNKSALGCRSISTRSNWRQFDRFRRLPAAACNLQDKVRFRTRSLHYLFCECCIWFPTIGFTIKKEKKRNQSKQISVFLKMGIDWKVQTAWLVINTPVAWVCHIKSFIAEYLHSMIEWY